MLRTEEIKKLSTKYQMQSLAVVREYCQHNILASFYNQRGSEKFLFKGGTALRILFKSPRFSEDLDFTGIYNPTYREIEDILTTTLGDLYNWGFNIDLLEAKKTTGGYLSKIKFSLYQFKFLIKIEISFRKSDKKIQGQVSSVQNDYIHTYNIIHLPREEIVSGKISALLTRVKDRDWYDLYFFLRGQMLEAKHRKLLPDLLEKLKDSKTDFKRELKDFLPQSHQMILRDFKTNLIREIKRVT
ncbi:nucleotidyl transferase AbiEii/AbiGii toxin family protein [Patescibacteria group bacterium]|nr:nucleotidyl transferase AbiEii/AbiGii toxin family protein [Patescibacteria group bacterium]